MASSLVIPQITYDSANRQWRLAPVKKPPCCKPTPQPLGVQARAVKMFEPDVHRRIRYDDLVAPAVLQAQLAAKRRIIAWRVDMCSREGATLSSSPCCKHELMKPALYVPPGSRSKSAGGSSGEGTRRALVPLSSGDNLTQAQIRDLQGRELTPDDYDFLLSLDDTIEKKNILSATEAESLLVSTASGESECSVCLTDLESGDTCIMLACGHCFHPPCIRQWLMKGRDQCPMCNAPAHQ